MHIIVSDVLTGTTIGVVSATGAYMHNFVGDGSSLPLPDSSDTSSVNDALVFESV